MPKVKTVFEDLNAILLNKLLKRNIDLIKYSPEQYYLQTVSYTHLDVYKRQNRLRALFIMITKRY